MTVDACQIVKMTGSVPELPQQQFIKSEEFKPLYLCRLDVTAQSIGININTENDQF